MLGINLVLGMVIGFQIDVPAQERLQELVQRAGNTDDDEERLELLRQIRALPGVDPDLAEHAEKLIRFVEQWVEGKNLHFYGVK